MSETTGASRDVRRRLLQIGLVLVVVAVVVVAVVVVVWLRDRQRDDEWAHGGDGVDITARIQATTPRDYPDALRAVGVPPEPAYPRVGQVFVVEVSWSGAPSSGGYAFVLLDGRLSPAEPLGASGSWEGPDGEGEGAHWNGSYEALSEHYPWLAGTASVRNADGSYSMDHQALSLPPGAEGGGVLSFFLPKDGIATSHPDQDLVLAMVHIDDGGEVRWARKVPLES